MLVLSGKKARNVREDKRGLRKSEDVEFIITSEVLTVKFLLEVRSREL